MEDLSKLKIKFAARGKHEINKSRPWRDYIHETSNKNNWLWKNLWKKFPKNEPPKEEHVLENDKISICYIIIGEICDRNKIVVDNIFSFKVAPDINKNNDHEIKPQIVKQCWYINDWPKWKKAIFQTELNLLVKREVFRYVVQTQEGVLSVGYKWVFVQKHN